MVHAEVLLSPSPHPGWDASPSQGSPPPCPQQYGTGTKFSRYHAFKFSRLGLGVAAFKREVQRPFCFTIVTPLHLCSLLMKKRKKPGRCDFIAFPDKLLPRLFWFRFTLQMVLFSFERSGFFFFFLVPRYLHQNGYSFVFSSKTFVPVTHTNKRISLVRGTNNVRIFRYFFQWK